MSELPWREKIVLFQINPEAATVGEIAQMAVELMESWQATQPPEACECNGVNPTCQCEQLKGSTAACPKHGPNVQWSD